jgi:hypothetical protein
LLGLAGDLENAPILLDISRRQLLRRVLSVLQSESQLEQEEPGWDF